MTRKRWHWLITCEHASCKIPAPYRDLFSPHQTLLETHRGWDPGTAPLALALGKHFGVQPHLGKWSRLLIELNRSLHHPALFSAVTKTITPAEKKQIIQDHWLPFRTAVVQEIQAAIQAKQRVLHLSVHSFTPVLNGQVRTAEVAWLYDPIRSSERQAVDTWISRVSPDFGWRVRRNYPYRGNADGHTTALRRQFAERDYVGIELEVNQAILYSPAAIRQVAEKLQLIHVPPEQPRF